MIYDIENRGERERERKKEGEEKKQFGKKLSLSNSEATK